MINQGFLSLDIYDRRMNIYSANHELAQDEARDAGSYGPVAVLGIITIITCSGIIKGTTHMEYGMRIGLAILFPFPKM